MLRKKRLILLVFVFLVLLTFFVIFVVLRYLSRNTAVLTDVTPEQVEQNNQNPETLDTTDYTKLLSQNLTVPVPYQSGVFADNRYMNLPEGFTISVFVAGLSSPRFFAFNEEGAMFIADKGSGKVVVVVDSDNDGIADNVTDIDMNLDTPHSVFYFEGDLYVGEQTEITVYRNVTTDGSYTVKQVLVDNLPKGGHSTRTVVIGPDRKMYVSIGSSCNVCEETDSRRAAVVRYNLDGTGEEIFAQGLRNSVGFIFHYHNDPQDYQIWSVNNGRDLIGDDIPPEEVNIIEKGKHYGWPYCYGEGIANPEYPEKESFCKNETVFPVYKMQAHSAPLGLSFVPSESTYQVMLFPSVMQNDLFIAFHGSWNRTVPTGYKVVRIDTSNSGSQTVNFITGWLDENGEVWGRPVGIGFDQNGVMYISDDKAGAIYRVVYKQ